MKILKIFGLVAAFHLLAFIFIFASPGCSSSPRNVPTPDATLPNGSGPGAAINAPADAGLTFDRPVSVPDGTPGRLAPTRPGSPNAAALTPAKSGAANVASVVPYTIQKGDSLWTIAKKNHITVAELTKTNNLSSTSSLTPGKKLMIPVKTPVAAAPTENAVSLTTIPTATAAADTMPHAPAEKVTHVVASGESMGTIARKFGVSVGELAAANNITDPAKIRIGQPLVIPNGKGGAKTATKSPAKPAATAKPVATKPAPAPETAPQPEVKPLPPGQDLDAGLKDTSTTEVPTIKVEDSKPEEPAK